MTDDSNRCRRCRKQITPMRHLCHACSRIEVDSAAQPSPGLGSVPLPDIGPAALAAFVADSGGGTAGDTDPASDESPGD